MGRVKTQTVHHITSMQQGELYPLPAHPIVGGLHELLVISSHTTSYFMQFQFQNFISGVFSPYISLCF